jgi:hypothetical protein
MPGRLVLDDDAGARGRRVGDQPVRAHRLFGEPAEEFRRIGGLRPWRRTRLAVFQRDQPGELVEPRGHQFPGLAQHLGAFARLASGPVGESGLRRIQRSIRIGDLGRGDACQHVFRRRVEDIEAFAAGALAPFAVDVKVGVVHR